MNAKPQNFQPQPRPSFFRPETRDPSPSFFQTRNPEPCLRPCQQFSSQTPPVYARFSPVRFRNPHTPSALQITTAVRNGLFRPQNGQKRSRNGQNAVKIGSEPAPIGHDLASGNWSQPPHSANYETLISPLCGRLSLFSWGMTQRCSTGASQWPLYATALFDDAGPQATVRVWRAGTNRAP
jgi:hypothetical protein